MTRREMLRQLPTCAAAALLAGCIPLGKPGVTAPTPTADQPQDLVAALPEDDLPQDLVAAFNSQNAPYRVQRVDADPLKLQTLAAAGQPVDIFRLEAGQLPNYAAAGLVRDLSASFDASALIKTADLLPVNNLFVYGGKRYGMVRDWSPDFMVWINKRLWQEAGVPVPGAYDTEISLADWRVYSQKLNRRAGNILQVVGTDFDPAIPLLFLLAEGSDPPLRLFGEKGQQLEISNNPAAVEAVRFLEEWKMEGGLPAQVAHPELDAVPRDCT